MNIILAHSRLARIRNKTVGLGIKAVESGIICSYPNAMLTVFEESSYHITAQSPLSGRISTETFFHTHRRKITYATIESSYPDAAFIIASNTINKTLVGTPARIVYFRQHTPRAVLDVILHQTIIAGYEKILVAVAVKLMDMMNCITQGSADELFCTTICVELVKSVFPGSDIKIAIGSSQHRHAVKHGCIALQRECFKLVCRHVEMIDAGITMVAEHPYLVVGIDQRTLHFTLKILHRILVQFVSCQIVSEHTLSVGRNPNILIAVKRKIQDRRRNLITQFLESVGCITEQIGSIIATYQQAFFASSKGAHKLVYSRKGIIIGFDIVSVKTAQSVVCTKPHVSLGTLNHATHSITRQTIIHRDRAHHRVDRSPLCTRVGLRYRMWLRLNIRSPFRNKGCRHLRLSPYRHHHAEHSNH